MIWIDRSQLRSINNNKMASSKPKKNTMTEINVLSPKQPMTTVEAIDTDIKYMTSLDMRQAIHLCGQEMLKRSDLPMDILEETLLALRKAVNIWDTEHSNDEDSEVEEPYDADSEEEWEFENFAHSVKNGVDHYLVAGGGMMNGNAYAEVVVYPLLKKVCYVEHGQHGTVTTYRNSTLKWDTDGRAVCFNIVDR